jgi:hypothetical protein
MPVSDSCSFDLIAISPTYTRLKDPYQAARSEERWPKCQKLNPFVVYKHRSDKCREQEVEAGEF